MRHQLPIKNRRTLLQMNAWLKLNYGALAAVSRDFCRQNGAHCQYFANNTSLYLKTRIDGLTRISPTEFASLCHICGKYGFDSTTGKYVNSVISSKSNVCEEQKNEFLLAADRLHIRLVLKSGKTMKPKRSGFTIPPTAANTLTAGAAAA